MTGLRIALALAVAAIGTAYPSAQRRLIPTQVDYAYVPKTWEEAAAHAEVVAVVRLRSREYREDTRRARYGHPVSTRFEADVIEVLRNSGRRVVNSIIDISRFGGVMSTPTGPGMLEEAGFPAWSTGTVLLVFLAWHDEAQAFTLPYGANAALEADQEGRVRSFGKGGLASSQKGKPFAEMLAEARARIR